MRGPRHNDLPPIPQRLPAAPQRRLGRVSGKRDVTRQAPTLFPTTSKDDKTHKLVENSPRKPVSDSLGWPSELSNPR